MPAGLSEASARMVSAAHEAPARLADLLRAAELRGVDCVLFDTAAGLMGMTETIVKACDYVVLPQQAEPLARAQAWRARVFSRMRGADDRYRPTCLQS